MNNRDMEKFFCKCGGSFESKYSNEYLQEKYPYIEGDNSFISRNNIKTWMKLKRFVKCNNCGKEKKISKKLLMKISIMNRERLKNE